MAIERSIPQPQPFSRNGRRERFARNACQPFLERSVGESMLHIVDDEEVIRDSLIWLARSRAIAATAYAGGQDFLDALGEAPQEGPEGECVLLDIRMPETSGLALFEALCARGLKERFPV